NKAPYLQLKQAVRRQGVITGGDDFWLGPGRRNDASDTLEPTQNQIREEILPALQRALASTEERDFDIISSCLVALAKIGQERPGLDLVETFRARLGAHNQEIRETAAVALGIAGVQNGGAAQLELLSSLVAGRAVGGGEARERTRAFAAYGLGLLANGTANLAIKRGAFDALSPLLASEDASGRNLQVAAIHGLSLLGLDGSSEPERALLGDTLACLEAFYRLPLGAGSQLRQAHCPTAIAKLLGPDHERAADYRALFRAALEGRLGKDKRSNHDLRRSAALALGRLGKPDDRELTDALLATYRDDKDAQTRYFSILALGQIGGAMNRDALLKTFDKARAIDRPWSALALGLLAFEAAERQSRQQQTPEPDRVLGDTLLDAFRAEKSPDIRGALAIALGLARYLPAADALRQELGDRATWAKEELAGYFCIGLALMEDRGSKDAILQIVHDSPRLPLLLQQAAVALGKLGDKRAAADLVKMLEGTDGNLAKASAISGALGFIGDRGTVHPLVQLLSDESRSQLPRAFAAVALGGIADKEMLPWNSKLGIGTNYRAATETLTNRVSGILDIL
ncbi:MAG: hypothetical protein KDE27_03495, partial [Planctomycetes bacterium]|nr:hypothetical protein [Planctomycetota bacterium]